jgi:hypothetical protein
VTRKGNAVKTLAAVGKKSEGDETKEKKGRGREVAM